MSALLTQTGRRLKRVEERMAGDELPDDGEREQDASP